MEHASIISVIALGGVMGAVGQGIRVAVGLKKANDVASTEGLKLAEVFEGQTLMVSLFIGFTAGVLAMIALSGFEIVDKFHDTALPAADKEAAQDALTKLLLGLIAAGYAGADFIEGFVKRYLPGKESPASQARKNSQEPDSGQGLMPPPAMG